MLKLLWKLKKDREGATAIEFAIVAPVLFLFMFGTIEYGLIMFASSVLEGATVNAARLAKTGAGRSTSANVEKRAEEDSARVKKLIMNRAPEFLDQGKLFLVIKPESLTSPVNTVGNPGEMVTYSSTYKWNIITPIMRQFLGDSEGVINLRSVAVVYNEPWL